MAEYIVKQDKNGKNRYYRVEGGKKTAIKKAEYEAHIATAEPVDTTVETKKEDKTMSTNFKQSRWMKVHAQGQANFESKNNVMDITVGTGRAQADILYSTKMVRTIEKAAQWLLHSLEVARANEAVALASESVLAKAAETTREDDELTVEGEGWVCTIENMGDGEFKAQLTWTFKAEDEQQLTLDVENKEATEESVA